MVLPVIWALLRAYAPIIVFPVAATIGVIGYALESTFRDKYTPGIDKSVEDQRKERQLLEEFAENKEEKRLVPKSIFEKNMSPQLVKLPKNSH